MADNIKQRILVAPGILYQDPDYGPADTDGAGGDRVSAVDEPIIMTYNQEQLALSIDDYGNTIFDLRDVTATVMFTFKFTEHNEITKKMYFGDNRIADSGVTINIPGPESGNCGLSATYHQYLFVTKASKNAHTTSAPYNYNIYILRGQCRPVADSSIPLGNEPAPLEVDMICTIADFDSGDAWKDFPVARISSIANLTIYNWKA